MLDLRPLNLPTLQRIARCLNPQALNHTLRDNAGCYNSHMRGDQTGSQMVYFLPLVLTPCAEV